MFRILMQKLARRGVRRRDAAATPLDRPEPPGAQGWAAAPFSGDDLDWARAPRGLRLRTLVLLRWVGVAGQLTALAIAAWLKMELPYAACLATVAVSAGVNLFTSLNRKGSRLAGGVEAVLQLGFDLLQLGVLLHFTGGLDNPFSLLLVSPVAVAAATLPTKDAALIGAFALSITALLNFWSVPLVWPDGPVSFSPTYHLANWAATVGGITFTAAYAWQASAEASRMELALQATQAVLAREQRLSALGALAAAAAHELGTPLSTIQVVARELTLSMAPDDPRAEDVQLLLEQAKRCRDILRRLAKSPTADDALHNRVAPEHLLEEVIEPYLSGAVQLTAKCSSAPGTRPLEMRRLPEVQHGLSAFVENAVDFAASAVQIIAYYDDAQLDIVVHDDGPGLSPDILSKLGEPYVTTRSSGEGSRTGHMGLGLGFFIAKTLLERTGAAVTFGNAHQGGAQIIVRWPREAIEATGIDQQGA